MIEVESVHSSAVLYGETRILLTTDDADYLVIVEWTKLPDEYKYDEAYISRVKEIKDSREKWYENGEWESIPNWAEIEEKVWKAFDNH